MTTVSKPKSDPGRFSDSPVARVTFLLISCGLLIYFVGEVFKETVNPSLVAEMAPKTTEMVHTAGAISSGALTDGEVNGVPYYHCAAAGDDDRDIILLHGAKFTKEDWLSSKILHLLCAHGRVSATALDLSVQSDHKKLLGLLRGLAFGEGLLQPDGNYVVVTPSASGKTMVDWINHGDHDELLENVGLWVPIASPAIANVDEAKLSKLRSQGFSMLAMYGDQDKMGQQVSEKLAQVGGAKVKKFPGPHPFYFDIAEEFTDYLLGEIHALQS